MVVRLLIKVQLCLWRFIDITVVELIVEGFQRCRYNFPITPDAFIFAIAAKMFCVWHSSEAAKLSKVRFRCIAVVRLPIWQISAKKILFFSMLIRILGGKKIFRSLPALAVSEKSTSDTCKRKHLS